MSMIRWGHPTFDLLLAIDALYAFDKELGQAIGDAYNASLQYEDEETDNETGTEAVKDKT